MGRTLALPHERIVRPRLWLRRALPRYIVGAKEGAAAKQDAHHLTPTARGRDPVNAAHRARRTGYFAVKEITNERESLVGFVF